MKIESITLKDFKCFENLQLQLTKPVSLFFGRNAAGKTSLAQAIALTMTGKVNGNGCDRTPLARYSANDFTASASVFQNDQQYASTQKASVRESIDPSLLWNMLHTSRETISAVIDTGNFLNLHPDEKKRIIFDLLPDLKMDAASLPGHLDAWLAGKYAFTADELMPLLDKPATMETAYNQAFETRRIAKRDLKAQGAIAKIPEGLTRDHVSSYIVNLQQELAAIHTAMGESKGMAAGEKKQAGNEIAVIDAEVLQIESLYRGFEPEEAKRHLVNLQRDSAALTGEIERMKKSFADMQQELGKLLAMKRRQDDICAQAQAFSGFCPLLPVITCKTKEVKAHMTELARPDNTCEQALEQQHEKMTPVRQAMLAERPKVEEAMQAVFSREGFTVRRVPAEHAGGKWQLRYPSAGGQGGNLEVDVNFMFRIPLWPIQTMDSRPVGIWQAAGIDVVDMHELAAGKLSALLSRRQARDLFDCSNLFHLAGLDRERLRLAFVVYGAMSRKDWRTVTPNDVDFDIADLDQKLIPTLRASGIERIQKDHFGKSLVADCRKILSGLLPFTDNEMEFLNQVLDKGKIVPALLTDDADMQDRIRRHPLLEWKAMNVREFKKLKQ